MSRFKSAFLSFIIPFVVAFSVTTIVLSLFGCSGQIVSKYNAGLCSRAQCGSEVHIKDGFCRGCGYCLRHCISGPFQGLNR